jgi:ABC-2 type transport system ATP-binding protein
LLLLDEPTTAVDPVSRGELWRLLYEFIMQGISVIIATPDMDEAERCHRVALLQQGKLIACDTPENLKTHIGKKVCSFSCDNTNKARRIIVRELNIAAQVYGSSLRIFLNNPDKEFSIINRHLEQANVQSRDFLQVKPNMGDVYFSLLDHKGEADKIVHEDSLVLDQFQQSLLPAQSSEAVVEVKNISKHYGEFRAVDDISFTVNRGTVFGLLGPNGAGKTTLIKMMCGLIEPTDGQALIVGYDVCRQRRLAKSNIGYMSQLFSLYPDLSVIQNLEFYASIYGLSRQTAKARINWAIDLAGLQDKKAYLARELPTGWRQKLALGAALMHQPKLLFLDEPTSGVDPIARAEFWDIIYTLSENGITVIVTTHFMGEADRCNLIGLVSAGKLIGMGSPEQLKDSLPSRCYEIRTSALLETYHTLSSFENILQISLFGDTVHVTTHADGELRQEEIREAGLSVDSIEQICPTMEDVFINKISSSQEALV